MREGMYQHWCDHNLCVGRRTEGRAGAFVTRAVTCQICGREETEFIYRPRFWGRVFAKREQRVRVQRQPRQEPALFQAWGNR